MNQSNESPINTIQGANQGATEFFFLNVGKHKDRKQKHKTQRREDYKIKQETQNNKLKTLTHKCQTNLKRFTSASTDRLNSPCIMVGYKRKILV